MVARPRRHLPSSIPQLEVISLDDLLAEPYPVRRRRGRWVFNAKTLRLTHDQYNYGIDLRSCKDAPNILDWILQLSHKAWISGQDLGDLVRQFDHIFSGLQGKVCPWGEYREIDPVAVLKKNVRERGLK